jgi:hypothetical protein
MANEVIYYSRLMVLDGIEILIEPGYYIGKLAVYTVRMRVAKNAHNVK